MEKVGGEQHSPVHICAAGGIYKEEFSTGVCMHSFTNVDILWSVHILAFGSTHCFSGDPTHSYK